MTQRACIALFVLTAGLAGQVTPPERREPAPGAPTPGVQRTVRGSCSEPQSRDLFRACDADGDDRLDVFETSDALDTLRGPRDTGGFARLDRDRDGYVSWPEFDATLRDTLGRGSSFVVRTARPFAPTAPAPQAATPAERFLVLHDSNRNGGLEPGEIDTYVQRDKKPPELAASLKQLDRDGSGRVEAAELAPWFNLLGGLPAKSDAPAFPTPWAEADLDRNGVIDAAELATVLRHLDVALARWAEALLLALDRNGDGVLQPGELPGARPAKGQGTASLGPRQLPGPTALR